MAESCVFCKIVAGEIPSVRVYEDADALAFMDIGPVAKGHTLVIPKAHYDPITGTPVEVLKLLIAVVQRVAKAQYAGLHADGINVTQANGRTAGQVVPHLHFHVIPRFESDGLHSNWTARRYETPEELRLYAERIVKALETNMVFGIQCSVFGKESNETARHGT